jgi:hypothetical protein
VMPDLDSWGARLNEVGFLFLLVDASRCNDEGLLGALPLIFVFRLCTKK